MKGELEDLDSARDMAAVLLDLADAAGVERVSRAAIRAAWIADDPSSARSIPVRAPRARGRQRGDGRRATSDTVVGRQTLRWITRLERAGLVVRDDDAVVLLDRARLEELAGHDEAPPP